MKKSIKRVLIALNLQGVDTPGLVSLLRAIIKGFTNNANFTAADLAKLPVSLVDLGTMATNLEGTHTTRKSIKSVTLTAQEQDLATTALNAIIDTARFLEGFANKKATGDLAIAVQIITSVGFQIKKGSTKHPRSFEVVGVEKGLAHLRTKSVGPKAAYLWETSDDEGKIWSFPIVTLETKVSITNLKSKVEYRFRFASVKSIKNPTVALGSEQFVWSDVITSVIP